MVIILLLIIRLPMIIYGYPLLLPELSWMLVGEKLNEGFTMYKDIWESLEPLSAGTYYIIHKFFGKAQINFQVISLIFVAVQALLFNIILNLNNAYNERSLFPALLYIVFSSLFFDFYTLSPVLMGTTFLLPALHCILVQIRTQENDEYLFYTGFFIGIACLFYLPLGIFLLFALISLIIYTSEDVRKFFLVIAGFIFPLLMAMLYYYMNDALVNFYANFINPFFGGDLSAWTEIKNFFILLITPFVLLILSGLIISYVSKLVNYQQKILKVMGIWLVCSFATLVVCHQLYPFQFFVFIPGLAFFGAHYFMLVKSTLVKEISFLVIFGLIIFISYGVIYSFGFKNSPVDYEEMVIKKDGKDKLKGYKIVVFGEDRSLYNKNKLATPYLDWTLSSKHLMHLDNYNNISEVYNNFKNDLPDYIIDEQNIAQILFYRIPALKEKYEETEDVNVYRKKGI